VRSKTPNKAVPVGGALPGGLRPDRRLAAQVLHPVRYPALYEVPVLAVGDRTITFPAHPDAEQDGVYGIIARAGYGQTSRVLRRTRRAVVRDLVRQDGDLRAGEGVTISVYGFVLNPRHAHGLLYEDVSIDGPLGAMPAWLLPGGDRWALVVHGRGSSRSESLRILPALHAAGLTVLVCTYRNDEEAPPAPDGRYHLGASEWEDVAAAARFALAAGARELVLVGLSMGGLLALRFARLAPEAEAAVGVVLDSPLLDWRATLTATARRRRIPAPMARLVLRELERQIDVSLDDLDETRHARALRIPALVFHGSADPTVPVATSRRLRTARPDRVSLVELPGVGHVRTWNHDPIAYSGAVTRFLAGLEKTGN
jgi:hypothetical protein